MSEGIVAVGGTFDRLHDGHKALIQEAFRLGCRVIVGLTSDDFVSKEGKAGVASYAARRRRLMNYIKSRGLAGRATVVKINDRFGPVTSDSSITRIVVTPETRATALEANALRVKKGMPPMAIRTIGLVLAKDSLPISSTRIRRGELDGHGNPRMA